MPISENVIINDKLTGASAIASFLGISTRSAYHYIENGQLPAYRLGKKIYARKSILLKHIAALEEESCDTIKTGLLFTLGG